MNPTGFQARSTYGKRGNQTAPKLVPGERRRWHRPVVIACTAVLIAATLVPATAGAGQATSASARPQATTIPVGQFVDHVAVKRDGRTAYVVSVLSRTVTKVDLVTRRVRAVIQLPRGKYGKPLTGWGVTMSPDGNRLYVAANDGRPFFAEPNDRAASASEIVVVDTQSDAIIRRVRSRYQDGLGVWQDLPVSCLAVSPDGTVLYAGGSSTVLAVLDLGGADDYVDFLETSNAMGCTDVAVSRDGGRLYRLAPNGDLSITDAYTATPPTVLRFDKRPKALLQSSDGSRLFVVSGRSVTAIDPASGTAVRRRTLAQNICGATLAPDGSTIYVAYAYDGKNFNYGPPQFRVPPASYAYLAPDSLKVQAKGVFGAGCPTILAGLPRGRYVAVPIEQPKSLSVFHSS